MRSVSSLMPEEEGIPNTRGSCTVDEAVARLLGWFKSPISKRFIQVSEHGISIDQMPFMVTFYDSLDQTLYELRESARAALIDAASADEGYESLQVREHAVAEVDQLIGLARVYRLEIEDAAFRPESPFVVNRDLTEKTGVTHFTLVSLDKWAREKFKKSLFDSPAGLPDESSKPHLRTQAGSLGDTDNDVDMAKDRKYQSALVTIGLLLLKLKEEATAFDKGASPNESAIAKSIASIAEQHARGLGYGQGYEVLRKRFGAAREALRKWAESA